MKPIVRSALAFALATTSIVAAAPGCAVEEGDDEEASESTVEQPLTMQQLIASADWFSGCTGQAQLRKQGSSPRAMAGWFFNSEAGISLNAGSSTAGTIFLNPAGIQLSAPFTLTQSGNALTFKFARTPTGRDSAGKTTSHGYPMELDQCLRTQGLTWRATQECGGPNDKRCANGKVCDRGANSGLGACVSCTGDSMCAKDAHYGQSSDPAQAEKKYCDVESGECVSRAEKTRRSKKRNACKNKPKSVSDLGKGGWGGPNFFDKPSAEQHLRSVAVASTSVPSPNKPRSAVCDAAWRLAGTTAGAPAGFNTHVNYTGRVMVSGVPRTEFIGSVSECAYCEADNDGNEQLRRTFWAKDITQPR